MDDSDGELDRSNQENSFEHSFLKYSASGDDAGSFGSSMKSGRRAEADGAAVSVL